MATPTSQHDGYEYGLWDDEAGGLVEDGFWTRAEAARRRDALHAPNLVVLRICREHDGQPVDGCDECG